LFLKRVFSEGKAVKILGWGKPLANLNIAYKGSLVVDIIFRYNYNKKAILEK
jgi:hypothetical protein